MSVGEICDKELITAPFAYKILKKLQKAEIAEGISGSAWGYSLNRRAEDLTLYGVHTAIDPEFLIIDCLEPGYECPRNGEGDHACTMHCELCKIQKELCGMLKSSNLKDLLPSDCLEEPGYDCARNSADGQNCSVHCELAEHSGRTCCRIAEAKVRWKNL